MGETSIRELAEQHWNGEGDLVHAHHPVQPVLDRAGEEIAPGILTMISVASVNAIDTGDGLAMLDTGGEFDADHVFGQVRAWRPDAPVRAAVYSHHHIDHIFGTRRFEAEAVEKRWPPPVVYAHEDLPDHFRRYERTLGWNAAINQRQFAIPVDRFRWPDAYRYPDVTYREHLTFRQGELTFELHHARGETDDATWTFVPERRVLHPGDLFIWAVPNAGNPQKVQRYPEDWAAALRTIAAHEPELLLPAHGLPIAGRARIARVLDEAATALERLVADVLAMMNGGANLDEIVHTVRVSDDLLRLPYLRPLYDEPEFVVRNVWRRYGGWWDGNPANLKPAPHSALATELAALAGGARRLAERAAEVAESGDMRLACHLVELAACAAPDDVGVHLARAEIYERRRKAETSLMTKGIFAAAVRESRQIASPDA